MVSVLYCQVSKNTSLSTENLNHFQSFRKWLNRSQHTTFLCVKGSIFGVMLVRIFLHLGISLRTQSECGKMRTKIAPKMFLSCYGLLRFIVYHLFDIILCFSTNSKISHKNSNLFAARFSHYY